MLNILGLNFHLYGLLIGLGILAAIEASEWLVKQRKLQVHLGGVLYLTVIVSGIVGARFYHVIDLWSSYYSLQSIKVFYIWEGGLAIYGAILGGLIGLLGYYLFVTSTPGESSRLPRGSLFDLLDITFIGLPLAQAIGRWGNYFNSELIGKDGEPLFLYESILDLILFWLMIKVSNSPTGSVPAGRVFVMYLIGYGAIRFLLEPLRADINIWKISGIPTAQIFSVLAIIIGIILLIKSRSQRKFANG